MRLLILLLSISLSVPLSAAETWADDPRIEAFIIDMRDRHGFDEAALRARFAATEVEPTVLRLIAPPAQPTQRSWQRYRARFLTTQRIRGGVAFWAENGAAIERAAAQFGVPAEIIVAIIGVETEYGRNTGSFNVFQALATLAFSYPPRADFFRGELEQFMLLARENQLDLETTMGSYAGAIGIPQFMPGSQRRYAVDFDGDGRIDLAASADDAIGSVAGFLAAHGWRPGAPVATPAPLGGKAPHEWIEAGIRPTLDAEQIRAAGIDSAALPTGEKIALVDLVTPGAKTEYWWGFDNFYVITRYNRSSFYAMSVFQLADAIGLARRSALSAKSPAPKAGSRVRRRHAG